MAIFVAVILFTLALMSCVYNFVCLFSSFKNNSSNDEKIKNNGFDAKNLKEVYGSNYTYNEEDFWHNKVRSEK